MRRIAAVSLVLLAAVVDGVTMARAGVGEATPITKSEAVAFAHAVNLRTTDVPESSPLDGELGSPPEAAEVQKRDLHCGHRGRARAHAITAEGSVVIDRYMELVGSIVFVMPSDALAQAEVAVLPSRTGRACLASDIRRVAQVEGAPEGASYATKVTSVRVTRLLGPGAVALHVLAKLSRGVRFVYIAEVIFRVGAADILFLARSERRQFPAATERRLLALLHSRAKAHKL